MANWYVGSVGYTAVAQWAATHTYAVGNYVRQLAAPSVGNERVFKATSITTGISSGAEPAWNLAAGATTTDTGVTWTEVTGKESEQAAGAWAAPFARIETAFAMSSKAVAGDTVYVASNHSQTQAGSVTITSNGTAASPCSILCVDETGTGHVPPSASSDLKTTAIVATTGNTNPIAFDGGVLYVYGLTLNSGDSTNSCTIQLATSSGANHVFEACSLVRRGTGGSSNAFTFGSGVGGSDGYLMLINTTMTFGNTTDQINVRNCRFIWKNTASALQGATFPTTMFVDGGGVSGGTIVLEGVDLSALGSGKTIMPAFEAPRDIIIKDCKLGASVTIAATPTKLSYFETYVERSDSAAQNNRSEKYSYTGTQTTELTVIRTGGASDGTTGFSMKVVTTANSKWQFPFTCKPIAIWNSTTGSNVVVTIEGIWNAAALPNNDDVWFDVEYLGSGSNPQGSFKSGTKSNILASNAALTASTQAWDGQATARQNSHAYNQGDIIKLASNPGRLFFCTSAGTSAGSEPGGYASAVDGGSVTDSGATFRAAVRFKLAVTLTSPTPGMIGYLYAYWKAAKASSTFYIDPLITLS